MSLPTYCGMAIATSVWSFNPKLASSSSNTHPTRMPLGPLYLNMFALPLISVGSFLTDPPTNSYRSMAIWIPSSLVGTTMSANGLLTSTDAPDFPRLGLGLEAPMAIAPPGRSCRLALLWIAGDVTTEILSTKSPETSPTDSSAPTRILCRANSESLKVDKRGTKNARVLPLPVEPLTTIPMSFPEASNFSSMDMSESSSSSSSFSSPLLFSESILLTASIALI
mmetsp:Transcript_21973/g.61114  ORF Transcript_21973/g.61114 Transcript_21973/m.61114 type:complete len:224 (-) Transcript_21973:742-1413(-)